MPNLTTMDNFYMDVATRVAAMSHARRSKVGAVLTKEQNIISYGWNGTPAGDDNACEDELPDGTLVTKKSVLHSESNLLTKLTASGGVGSQDATLYVTLSPCFECSKLIKQAKIKRVVYGEVYRDTSGIDFLNNHGIKCEKLNDIVYELEVKS